MADQTIKGLGDVPRLLKRFKEAQTLFNQWRSLHQEAYDFAAPERETFRFRSPGQRKNRHVFDSTAVDGLETFANRIESSIVPPWQQWESFKAGSEIPKEEEEEVNKGLEKITDTFFNNLNHSNFSTEISQSFIDVGIGTGAILFEEEPFGADRVFRFTNIPLAELYPERPGSGPIESSWRLQEIDAGQIKVTWPDADLPPTLQKIAADKPQSKVKIVSGMLKNEEDGKYWHVIIHEQTKHILFSQSFNTKRLIVFRWRVVPGEVYGRGPIIRMLPDIRTLNKVVEFFLGNAALQMSGIYTAVDDGVFNPHTVRIAPGTVIPVSSNNSSNPSLTALTPSGNIGIGLEFIERLQDRIEKGLFSNPLGDVTDSVKSATEQTIRLQEMLKDSGASFGRFKSELLEPLSVAGVDILSTRGLIPVIRVDGKEVTLRQESPLAKAEDLDDFQSSMTWFSTVSQLPPEIVAGSVKVEDLPGYWAEKLNVPAKLIRTETERKDFADKVVQAAEAGLDERNIQKPV